MSQMVNCYLYITSLFILKVLRLFIAILLNLSSIIIIIIIMKVNYCSVQ